MADAPAPAAPDIIAFLNEVGRFFAVPIQFLTNKSEAGTGTTPEDLFNGWRNQNSPKVSLFGAGDLVILDQLYVLALENPDMPTEVKQAAETAFLKYAAAALTSETRTQQVRAVRIASKGITQKMLSAITLTLKNMTPKGVTDSYTFGSFKEVPTVDDKIREKWLEPALRDLSSSLFGFETFPAPGQRGLGILACRAGSAGAIQNRFPKVYENVFPYQDWNLAADKVKDAEIEALFKQANTLHLEQLMREVKSVFSEFDGFPGLAREALIEIVRIDSIENMRGSFIKFVRAQNWFMAAQRSENAETNTDAMWNDKVAERFYEAYEQARLNRN